MSNFESILKNATGAQVEDQRTARLTRNEQELHLSMKQAIRLDDIVTATARACITAVGSAVDSLADDPEVQGFALTMIPQVTGNNLQMLSTLVQGIATEILMYDKALPANPNKPDCDCEVCTLQRAIGETLVAGEKLAEERRHG